jgi:protein SCO1/2
VDPEHDDVARLREYLTNVNPTFRGATGTPEQLETVRRDYGVSSTKLDAGLFNHSSSTFLIDRKGVLRALMPYGQPPDAYVHDVRILLSERGTDRADAGS